MVVTITAGELRLLSGHTGSVKCIAFSPDGKFIASVGNADFTLKIWNISDGTCINTINNILETSVAYSPDGKFIASGSEFKTVKIWRAENGTPVLTIKGADQTAINFRNLDTKLTEQQRKDLADRDGHSSIVTSVAYSPDGKFIASGSDDYTVKIWQSQNGAWVRTLSGHTGGIKTVAYSPNGKFIISAGVDCTIKIWNTADGKCIRTLTGHTGTINKLLYSPDGTYIASASDDSSLKIWDAASGTCFRTFIGHGGAVKSLSFSSDGKYIVTGSEDTTIKIWDLGTGTCKKTLSGHTGSIWSVSYSPNGKTIASGSDDNSVRIWSVTTYGLIEAYAETKLKEWLTKGKNEKQADYDKRTSEIKRAQKQKDFIDDGTEILKKEYLAGIQKESLRLLEYDTATGTYGIGLPDETIIALPVPAKEADAFKEQWDKFKLTDIDASFQNDAFTISKLTLRYVAKKKTYTFSLDEK